MNGTKELTTEVVNVLQGVLIHQRLRWATLLGHRRNYEAWWKAEFALALENWAWSWHGLPEDYAVLPEAKPANFLHGAPDGAVDLLIAPWDDKNGEFKRDASPRVWIELKERASWWRGNAKKVFGESNDGLAKDIKKWDGVDWGKDVLLACQLLTCDGPKEERLPEGWNAHLADTLALTDRCIGRKTVTYPLPGEPTFRHCTLDVYQLYPAVAEGRRVAVG